MIAKIHTGSNVEAMVYYNAHKTQEKKGEEKAQFLGTRNILDNTTIGIIQAISNRNKRAPNISSPNIHISLNFPKEEEIDNDKILKIADSYMEKMKFSDQPYAIYRHYDRNHPHIHIVSTQIDTEGKKINDSNIFYRSVTHSRAIEKEYGLIQVTKKTNEVKVDLKKSSGVIDYLNISIKNALFNKPIDFYQLDKLLMDYGIKRVEGEKGFFFKFDELKIDGIENNNIFRVSELDLSYNSLFFEEEFKKNQIQKNLYKSQIQAKIHSLTKPLDKPIPLKDLETLFNKKGLKLQVETIKHGEKTNQINKLFIKDLKSGITYSASDLKIRTKDFVKAYVLLKDHIITEDIKDLETLEQLNAANHNRYDDIPLFEISESIFDGVLNMFNQKSNTLDDSAILNKKKAKRKKK